MTALKSKNKRKKYLCISWKKINAVLFILLILIGAANLAISNDMTAKGFAIRDLNRQSRLLAEENRQLESRLMTMKSYDVIKHQINKLHLVSANNITYLSAKDSSMARR